MQQNTDHRFLIQKNNKVNAVVIFSQKIIAGLNILGHMSMLL